MIQSDLMQLNDIVVNTSMVNVSTTVIVYNFSSVVSELVQFGRTAAQVIVQVEKYMTNNI